MVLLQPCRLNDPAECARLADLAVSELGRDRCMNARDVTAAGNDATIAALDHGVGLPHRDGVCNAPGPALRRSGDHNGAGIAHDQGASAANTVLGFASSSGSASPYRGLVLLRRRPNTQHAA